MSGCGCCGCKFEGGLINGAAAAHLSELRSLYLEAVGWAGGQGHVEVGIVVVGAEALHGLSVPIDVEVVFATEIVTIGLAAAL